jgi:hypothetical protein
MAGPEIGFALLASSAFSGDLGDFASERASYLPNTAIVARRVQELARG